MGTFFDKYLFLHNPIAGRGRARRAGQLLHRLLSISDLNFEWIETRHRGQARELAEKRSGPGTCVVACGGDGTVHEVINGLASKRKKAAFAVYPIGTGNDFAKNIAATRKPQGLIDGLKKGRSNLMDVGRLEIDGASCGFFGNNVGIGFDGYVNILSSRISKLSGQTIYLYAVLKALFNYRHPQVTIDANEEQCDQTALLVNVGNGTCSGGGFYLTPQAKIDDGYFDVCVISSVSKLRLIRAMPLVMRGKHAKLPEVKMFRTERIEVRSASGLPVHADGEIVAEKARRLTIEVLPKHLNLICP